MNDYLSEAYIILFDYTNTNPQPKIKAMARLAEMLFVFRLHTLTSVQFHSLRPSFTKLVAYIYPASNHGTADMTHQTSIDTDEG